MTEQFEVRDGWNDPFFRMPNIVVDKHELDPYEFTIFAILRRFANGNYQSKAWPSLTTLEELGNMSRHRAIKSISSLVAKGYLKKAVNVSENGKKKNNVYTIINPFGSARDALGVVHEMHQPSARDALGVVHDVHSINNNIYKEQYINNKDKKTSCSKLKFETKHMVLAELLQKEMKANNPKLKEQNLESWANTFRLMMERDGRSFNEIKSMIIWCQHDTFWYKNILSAEKLRKQFDRLTLEMNSKRGRRQVNGQSEDDEIRSDIGYKWHLRHPGMPWRTIKERNAGVPLHT
jgi:hypothetical protein